MCRPHNPFWFIFKKFPEFLYQLFHFRSDLRFTILMLQNLLFYSTNKFRMIGDKGMLLTPYNEDWRIKKSILRQFLNPRLDTSRNFEQLKLKGSIQEVWDFHWWNSIVGTVGVAWPLNSGMIAGSQWQSHKSRVRFTFDIQWLNVKYLFHYSSFSLMITPRHIVGNESTILRIIDRSLSNASKGILGTCNSKPSVKEECDTFEVDNILELFQAITSDIMGEVGFFRRVIRIGLMTITWSSSIFHAIGMPLVFQ